MSKDSKPPSSHRSVYAILLPCLLALTSCGSGAQPATDVSMTAPQAAPVVELDTALREIDAPAPGVSRVAYRTAVDRGEEAAPDLWLKTHSEGRQSELWLRAAQELTDLFITLKPPAGANGPCRVVWDGELEGRFLAIGVRSADGLELGLAGIRRAAAAEVVACASPEQLANILADRWMLEGEMRLCTVQWDAGSEPDPQVFDVRKTATAIYQPDQVTDLAVRVVDGEYEPGWPARMKADYNQDGLVGIYDLTPLGILFGLSQLESVWMLEAHARVDGNGDGLISINDLIPLGQNYDSTTYTFRVERSAGNAGGPGAQWESLGSVPRTVQTQYGEAVTSTSGPPYQRLRDAVQSGWVYYRVTGIGGDGLEGIPSAAVLSPDATPPSWPGEQPYLALTENPWDIELEFNETAADDRGAAVEYCIQLSGGDGDPVGLLVFLEINKLTSYEPLASPCVLWGYYPPPDYDHNSTIRFREGKQYYVRLGCTDESGNKATADWVGFISHVDSEQSYSSPFLFGEWDLWINKEGTVRFTPPSYTYSGGESLELFLYSDVRSWFDSSSHNHLEDFDPGTRVPYSGGEVVWEHAVEDGEMIYIGFEAVGAEDKDRFSSTYAYYPVEWLEPFAGDYLSGSDAKLHSYQLSDGTPYLIGEVSGVIVFYRGGTAYIESLEGIDEDAYSHNSPEPMLIPGFNELLFHQQCSSTTPGMVTWWKSGVGITGTAKEPDGVFTSSFASVDYIQAWVVEDANTLVGVRGETQVQGDGTRGLEIWQAKRNGEITLRETVFPMELNSGHTAKSLALPDGEHVLMILEPGAWGQTPRYYAFRNADDSWSLAEWDTIPSALAESEWEDIRISRTAGDILSGTAQTFIIARASMPSASEPEGTISYIGLYTGDIRQGIESYTALWDYRSDEILHPDYPVKGELSLYFSPPYDGTTHGGISSDDDVKYLYTFNPDGSIARIHTLFMSNFYNIDFKFYWKDHVIQPGIANILISDDGQWLKPRSEGQWGMAYYLDD